MSTTNSSQCGSQPTSYSYQPLVVLTAEAVVEQRLRVCQRTEHAAVDVRERCRDSAYGFQTSILNCLR